MTVLTLSIVLSLSVSCLAKTSSTFYTRFEEYCPHYEIGNYSSDTYISCAMRCRQNANCATFCYSENFEECSLYRRKAYVTYTEKGGYFRLREYCLEKKAHLITPTTELEMEQIFEVATDANANHVGKPMMHYLSFIRHNSDSTTWKFYGTYDLASYSFAKYWGHDEPSSLTEENCVVVVVDELQDVLCGGVSYNTMCQEHEAGSCHQENFDASLGMKCFKPKN